MVRILFFTFSFVFSVSCFGQNVDVDTLKSWLSYISSDTLRGRSNGSKELNAVQDWISGKFEQYGLKSLDTLNGYDQRFYFKTYPDSIEIRNVIGYFPGEEGLEDSIIILSAHIDHIGMDLSDPEDSVYNGADDDGSGIVTLLGLAKRIHDQKIRLNSTVILAIFGGEEIGLVGSGYFCKSKVIPFDRVKLNINIEVVGRSEELGKNKYYVTGPKKSDLTEFLSTYNEDKDWKIKDLGYMAKRLYSMADNYSFERHVNNPEYQVPAHSFATSSMAKHIHSVSDEAKYIDFENLGSFVNYLTELVVYISDNDVKITYKK